MENIDTTTSETSIPTAGIDNTEVSSPSAQGLSQQFSYDAVVVGAGPGGYMAAIRLAQLGKNVAIVEKTQNVGGTCLNIGCIPSKALLDASHKFWSAKHEFEKLGISCGEVKIDINVMMNRKKNVISDLNKGILHLFKKHDIKMFNGLGSLTPQKTVKVVAEGQADIELKAEHIILAVGSVPHGIKAIQTNEVDIVTSTGALQLESVPKHLVVIGGGYIGLELGTVWARLGAKVTVIEYHDTLLSQMDQDVVAILRRSLEELGIKFKMGCAVEGMTYHEDRKPRADDHDVDQVDNPGHISLHVRPINSSDDVAPDLVMCDAVLVAAGREPITEPLNLKELGIETDKKGAIVVDEHYQTTVASIYAIGDCIKGPMLAHKAMDEGVAVAEQICGQAGFLNYSIIPAVIFTHPEVATVGESEVSLKKQNKPYRVGKFPFSANGRAKTVSETVGFVKILADPMTDQILGCAVVGAEAGSMIAQVAAVMEFGGTSEDIARTCHAHPTLNEVVREAAWGTFSKPLHS